MCIGERINNLALALGYPRTVLKPDVERLLDAYRSTCQVAASQILPSPGAATIDPSRIPKTLVDFGEREVMAYLASQFPYAYGPIERVLLEVQTRISDFAPASILDFGTGPGTALL